MNAQQLKNSILQMAVQGKLVPQDPNDEPASVLLERIRAEKERLIKEKKIKREKNPSVIFKGADNTPYEKIGDEVRSLADLAPFEIPLSWEWCRVGDLFSNMSGLSYKKDALAIKTNQMVRVLRGGNIGEEQFCFKDDDVFISSELVKPELYLRKNYMITPAVSSLDHIGKIALIDRDYSDTVVGGFVLMLIPHYNDDIMAQYLLYAFAAKHHRDNCRNITHKSGQAFYNLSREQMMNLPVPIPPREEMERIVAMLKQVLPKVEDYSVVDTTLQNLNANFPEALKKSILQEAVQGKLVPQDPNDEPASVLLERIRAEKKRLIKEGKIKKDKHESVIFRRGNSHYENLDGVERCIDDELPFDLPNGWEWCRVGDLFSNMSGLAYKKDALAIKTDKMIRVLRGGNIGEEHFLFKGDDVFISSELVKPELYLRKNYMITPAVSSLDHIGKIALIDKDYSDTVVGGFVLMLIPHFNNDVVSQYLLYAFAAKHHRDNCRNITHKSGQAFYNLSREQMMNLPVPIPPLAEQRRIVQRIEELLPLIKGL